MIRFELPHTDQVHKANWDTTWDQRRDKAAYQRLFLLLVLAFLEQVV